MRINNKRIIPWIEALYGLLILALVTSIILTFIPIEIIVSIISPYLLVGIVLFVLFILYKLGPQHLEYDSDGEVIHIKTEDVFWSKYFPKKRTIFDFPKNKLVSYRVRQTFLKKTLELIVTSKRTSNGITKLKLNITYLSKSEISDLKRSLYKIVKKSEKNKHT